MFCCWLKEFLLFPKPLLLLLLPKPALLFLLSKPLLELLLLPLCIVTTEATSIRNVIVVGSAGVKKFTVRTGAVWVIAAYFLLFPSLVFLTVLVVTIPKTSKPTITTLLLLSKPVFCCWLKEFLLFPPHPPLFPHQNRCYSGSGDYDILFVATETATLVIVAIFPILAFTSIFFFSCCPPCFLWLESFDEKFFGVQSIELGCQAQC